MKKCRQCRRNLAEEEFRVVKSRSTGMRDRGGDSRRSVCRTCENMNVQAHQLLKCADAGVSNTAKWTKVVDYFKMLRGAGIPILHSAAVKLLDKDDQIRGRGAADANCERYTYNMHDLYQHLDKLRTRSYSSFDEADRVHRAMIKSLEDAGLYEDANNLIDEWFEEG